MELDPSGLSTDDLITLIVFSGLELVCLLVVLIAGVKLLITFLRSSRLTNAPGTVVGHQPHVTTMRSASGHGSNVVTLMKPVVRYVGADGQPRDILHSVASSSPPALGTVVTVAYDPRDPSRAEVVSFLARYFGSAVVVVAVGFVLLLLIGVELSILG